MSPQSQLKPTWQTALANSNLSLRKVALEIGISHTYLASIAAGKVVPSDSIQGRLLAYFKDDHFKKPSEQPISSDSIRLNVICKRCSSSHTIKCGIYKGQQRFQCRDCLCVFIPNAAPLHGRLPSAQLETALLRFYAGDSLEEIRTLIFESSGFSVTVSGLEQIIYRYTHKAVTLVGDLFPQTGRIWLLETDTLLADQSLGIVDLLDLDSGYIIASEVVPSYIEKNRESALKRAIRLSGRTPQIIPGPNLVKDYPDTLDLSVSDITQITSQHQANFRQFRNSSLTRQLLFSRRQNFNSLPNNRLICHGWRINYNFQASLMPIGASCNNWRDIIQTP